MTYQATDIAKYIINKCTIEKHAISNLQLQEILYYIQKKFLEIELKAFEDDFEVWPSGPVIPEVYYIYCGFGAGFKNEVRYSLGLQLYSYYRSYYRTEAIAESSGYDCRYLCARESLVSDLR